MEQEKILRINELAKKKKEVGLTDEETRERSELYAQYIREFREPDGSDAQARSRRAGRRQL